MLSPALAQLLERARSRFGLEVEVLDSGLKSLYPEGSTDFGQVVQKSPGLRRVLTDVMAAGRPQDVRDSGVQCRVYPLRHSPNRRQASGLLAIRRVPERSAGQDVEPWSELARAIVEADLASVDNVGEERQRSRRYLGVLRFIDFLTQTRDEQALADALVQAAAIWHDADARVYRRRLEGDFGLHTALPGVRREASVRRIAAGLLDSHADVRRLDSTSEIGGASAVHDTIVVPLSRGAQLDWALVLVGSIPADADAWLRVIGRVASVQLEGFAAARAAETRARFEALASRPAPAAELVALGIVRELVQLTGAAAGSLALSQHDETRYIAAVGQTNEAGSGGAGATQLTSERLVIALPVGLSQRALLELRAGGNDFTPDDAAAAKVCGSVLGGWLAGALLSLNDTAGLLERATLTSDFSRRIDEELQRAKRFDLKLSLIVLDVSAPSNTVAELQEALRRELRGSDVLGTTGSSQVAALLTHTDGLGLDNVVQRLRQRLTDAAQRLNVSDLRLGRAAFSAECRTADALLSAAVLAAEPVIVH